MIPVQRLNDFSDALCNGGDLLTGTQWAPLYMKEANTLTGVVTKTQDDALEDCVIAKDLDSSDLKVSSLRSLLGQAKGVIGKFQTLLDQEESQLEKFEHLVQRSGGVPDMSQLTSHLSSTFARQRDINLFNAQMHSSNFRFNLYNHCQNRTLVKIIEQGRAQIQQLETQVVELEKNMDCLDVQVQVQEERTVQLKSALDATRDKLQQTVTECRRELSLQQALIEKQQTQIASIHSSRQMQNALVSGVLLASAYVAVNSTLIDYPVSAVTSSVVMPLLNAFTYSRLQTSSLAKRKNSLLLKRFFKLALLLYLFQRLRSGLASLGLYNPNLSAVNLSSLLNRYLKSKDRG